MPRPTILLVDDDKDILLLYRLALKRKSDWNIFCAVDGSTALAQARDIQPNLIVLDVMLGDGLTGIDVCRLLTSQSSSSTSRVPIVVVTALNDRHTLEAAYAAGACAVWNKPVPPAQFVEHLEELMAVRE